MINQLQFNFPDFSNTFADFFAGAGGYSLGFIEAGMKCVSAIEMDFAAASTYWNNLCYTGWSHFWLDGSDKKAMEKVRKRWENQNTSNWLFPNGIPDNWLQVPEPMPCLNLFMMDIMKMEPEEWMKMVGVRPGEIAVFIGGPPCQGFSNINVSRNMFDERNQLPLRMIYFAKICRPAYVLIENVPGLISLGRKKGEKEGPFVHWIQQAFSEAGYDMEWDIHNAKDYGVPQNRRRVIFVATRKDINSRFSFKDIEKVEDGMNVWEAIGDLPPVSAGESYEGEPYVHNNQKGYVICPACFKNNKEARKICVHCGSEINNPIRGGILHAPRHEISLVDFENEIKICD